MSLQLDISDIVPVSVIVSPLAAPYSNFGTMMVMGSSDVIDVTQRYRQYANINQVLGDFTNTSPEYLAALNYFSQSPSPSLLYIGRWAQSATSAKLHGGILAAAAQLLANFTSVTTGGFAIHMDGLPRSITALNFSAQTNLNGVAAQIQTKLAALVSGSTCVWNSTYSRFEITDGSTGVTSVLGYGKPPTSTGYVGFAGMPSANDTVTFNGTVVTFVTSGATGNQVNLVAGNVPGTIAALLAFLNGSADTQLVKFTYYSDGVSKLYVEAAASGAGGDSLTLAKNGTNLSVSAATLSGGTATDVSALLALTAATGALAPVAGMAAESCLSGAQALANASSQWYALMVATATPPSDSDNIAIAAYILASNRQRIYCITIQSTTCLDPSQTADLASVLAASRNKRVFWQYSSSNAYAVASLFGRAATVNFAANNSTITLMFKQEPGITPESLTETQAATIKAKGGNVFVNYDNNTAILQPGQMSNGYFMDEVHGLDWLSNAIQTDVFNLFYQSSTKIPQTDSGVHLVVNQINDTLSRAVANGLVAPGVWNAGGFGQLLQGNTLSSGFYVYAPPIATQSQADRETRACPPIQIAAKLAGAIHSTPIVLNVNR